MKKNDFSEILLDQEELLSNSFDNEEWQTVKNIQQEKKKSFRSSKQLFTKGYEN